MAYDLKNETEVKEYIDKLGVEYRFGCFSEKKPDGEWPLSDSYITSTLIQFPLFR